VNVFPVTGVTLPLVSMGGSSFLFTCLAIGIILSVARNIEPGQISSQNRDKLFTLAESEEQEK
jgi:cell division protein FtsW